MRRFVAWGVVGVVVRLVFCSRLHLTRHFCPEMCGLVAWGVVGAVIGLVCAHGLHLTRRFRTKEPRFVALGAVRVGPSNAQMKLYCESA